MRSSFIALAVCCSFAGAAFAQNAPAPQTTGRMEERTLSLPKREVWNAASAWAVRNGFSPTISDFEGGTAEYVQNLGTPPCDRVAVVMCRASLGIRDWARCPVSKWMVPRNGMVKLIVLIAEDGDDTRVNLETRFVRFNPPSWVRCESTEVLEQEFFAAIVDGRTPTTTP